MVLQNNYIILDNENIKIFKYKNIPNFSFNYNFTKALEKSEDEIVLNKNCVDDLINDIDFNELIGYVEKIRDRYNVVGIKVNDEIFSSYSRNSFLPYILWCSFSSIENFDKNYEYLVKFSDKLFEYFTNNNLLNKYIKDIKDEPNLKYFISQTLRDLNVDNGSNFLELIKVHLSGQHADKIDITEIKIEFDNYLSVDEFIDNFKIFIKNYEYFKNILKKYTMKNESAKTDVFFLFMVSFTFKELLFNKYVNFLSDKNLLILNKYDKYIDIEKDIVFINNELNKYKNGNFYETIRKKILPFINKKVSNSEYFRALVLLNYILALQGNDFLLGGAKQIIRKWNNNFTYYEIEEIILLYFKIFKEMEEYEIIINHSYLIDYDIKSLQLVCDSYIEIKNYCKANEILDKIESYEPSLKYIKTTRNKILREEKMNSFSEKNDKIDFMSGIDFEELLTNKFNELGFFAEQTKGSGDFGADIIVETKLQTKIIIQCKRFKTKVNLKAVQEVIGAVGHFEADIGIVITNNEFLNSAKKLAKSNDIELWDRDRLSKFLSGDISFSILNEI